MAPLSLALGASCCLQQLFILALGIPKRFTTPRHSIIGDLKEIINTHVLEILLPYVRSFQSDRSTITLYTMSGFSRNYTILMENDIRRIAGDGLLLSHCYPKLPDYRNHLYVSSLNTHAPRPGLVAKMTSDKASPSKFW